MAWYTRYIFCEEGRYSPHFALRTPSGDAKWQDGIVSARKVEPVPQDIVADRCRDFAPAVPPDFITISSLYVASDSFRRIVEEFEPGVHQFIPVTLRDSESRPIESPYWFVNVLTVCDAALRSSALPELERLGRIPGRAEAVARYGSSVNFVDASLTSGKHLWRTPGFAWDVLFSDELYLRIRAARLRKLTVWRAIEVDVGAV
jgi:hypothetical protein